MKNKNRCYAVAVAVLLIILVAPAAASAAGRYMMCTGTNVRVRATPSTSGRVIAQIGKEAILVVGEKNTGEKFPWYEVRAVGEDYSENVPGWVYGQFLRKMKTRDDYTLAFVNGIAWGTPYSQISGLSNLSLGDGPPYPSVRPEGKWVYRAWKRETYKEGDIIIHNAVMSHVFDGQKRLVGFYLSLEWKHGNKVIEKIHDKLLEKLGESENISKGMDGDDIMLHNFKDFNVDFGTQFNTHSNSYHLFYYVLKKGI